MQVFPQQQELINQNSSLLKASTELRLNFTSFTEALAHSCAHPNTHPCNHHAVNQSFQVHRKLRKNKNFISLYRVSD